MGAKWVSAQKVPQEQATVRNMGSKDVIVRMRSYEWPFMVEIGLKLRPFTP